MLLFYLQSQFLRIIPYFGAKSGAQVRKKHLFGA